MEEFSIYVNSAEKIERASRLKKLYFRYRILLAAVMIVVLLSALWAYQYREFQTYSKVVTVSDEGSTKKNMEVYKDGIVKYNENQVAYYNSSGKKIWSKKYSVKNPVVKVCGEYVMIMDKNGSQVYVFNAKGKKYSFQTAYSITDAEVAEQMKKEIEAIQL